MIIGVDVDGVIYPWPDAANRSLTEKFGMEDPGEHTSWLFLESYLRDTGRIHYWDWLWSLEGVTYAFSYLDMIYDGMDGVVNQLLIDGHSVHFVTHRDPVKTAVMTAAYLKHYFGRYPWAGLHILSNGVSKADLLDWDVFIEDKPDNIYKLMEFSEDAFLFAPSRPWNVELLEFPTQVTIYNDPKEILQHVRSLEKFAEL